MEDLVAFLRARLDDDEERAKASAGAPWVTLQGVGLTQVLVDAQAIRDEKWKFGTLGHVASVERKVDADHIARHDPARVLAEVDAKRRLLTQFELRGNSVRRTVQPATGGVWDDLLRLLALPYAGHPGYRDEWRP